MQLRELRIPVEAPARNLAEAILQIQLDTVAMLTDAIAAGRFSRIRYQDWLAMESAACRVGALALDTVANWHGAKPELQAAAWAWAAEQREFAQLAAADIRNMDGFATSPPPELAQWHAYIVEVGQTQRAGEVLGAAALQAGMLRGPVRDILAVLATLPAAVSANAYLSRRLQSDAGALHQQRIALQNEYAAAALAVGARRAADWALPCLEAALGVRT